MSAQWFPLKFPLTVPVLHLDLPWIIRWNVMEYARAYCCIAFDVSAVADSNALSSVSSNRPTSVFGLPPLLDIGY